MLLLHYLVFFSRSGHGHRSVGDCECCALVGLEGHREGSTPLLALSDRGDAATLVCGVEHRQGLSVRASDRANKIHHLGTERKKAGILYLVTPDVLIFLFAAFTGTELFETNKYFLQIFKYVNSCCLFHII